MKLPVTSRDCQSPTVCCVCVCAGVLLLFTLPLSPLYSHVSCIIVCMIYFFAAFFRLTFRRGLEEAEAEVKEEESRH